MKTKCKLYLWEPDPTTECDICGLHDFDDKIVDVEDGRGRHGGDHVRRLRRGGEHGLEHDQTITSDPSSKTAGVRTPDGKTATPG
jgi:hypothetical protein